MDALNLKSPLATVQLISVFQYLNLISDFLLVENYLTKVDHNKPIPVVNALYEYLEQGRKDPSMNMKLIRNLLKGSDMYGERDNEELDEIFVNSMFDYIISSLVFDKYGNIYGFLADIVRRVDNSSYNHVLEMIKENLKNVTFENEHGANSNLTLLAVNRIYSDIILPLFPQPKVNHSLLSLDYILAQAGLTYLRLGRINDTYYSDSTEFRFEYINKLKLFDELLAMGLTIKNLLDRKKIDPLTLQVFALPILFFYVSTEEKVRHEIITDVIFDPRHWEAAYSKFFQFATNVFVGIENQLMKDNKYQLHLAFLNFQSRAAMAKSILDEECKFLREDETETKIPEYIENPERFQCDEGVSLPYVNNRFMKQIQDIGEIYGKYELDQFHEAFKNVLTQKLCNVEIKLLVRDPVINSDSNSSQQVFYDFFEFHFIENDTLDYYALIRKNYEVVLIKERDNPEDFWQKLGETKTRIEFPRSTNRVILKFANESTDRFYEKFIEHKKNNFENYLHDDNPLKPSWWKEFGLSLVPYYPCLVNNENFCKSNNVKFINKFRKSILRYLTDSNTRNLSFSVGATIKSVFMKNLIDEVTEQSVELQKESTFLPENKTTNAVFDKLSLPLEESEYDPIFINRNGIKSVKTIISGLKEETNDKFASVELFLNKTEFLKSSFPRNIGKKENRALFVSSLKNHTGYGYKFTYIRDSSEIAYLRTGYDFMDQIFISPCPQSSKNEKTYFQLNQTSLECETDSVIHEINGQLRKNYIQLLFAGISNHHDNSDNCQNKEYSEGTKYSNICIRYWNFNKKMQNEEKAVQLMIKQSKMEQKFTSEKEIRKKLKKFTLPDDETFISHFVNHSFLDDNFEETEWSKSCIIENSDLLNKLRYYLRLDDSVSIADGESRINSIYTFRERRKIEEGTSLENIIRDYNEQNAGFLATFEDYYAIRNFATTGNRRINRDTREAKLMKLALYKLAIRQSDDPKHEFETKLYRFELKPLDFVNSQIFWGKEVIWDKFTVMSTNVGSASQCFGFPKSGFRNIMYIIENFGSYFRSKIETDFVDENGRVRDKKVIFLPGSRFRISRIRSGRGTSEFGNVLYAYLELKSQHTEKYEWYKNVMSEITKINL